MTEKSSALALQLRGDGLGSAGPVTPARVVTVLAPLPACPAAEVSLPRAVVSY